MSAFLLRLSIALDDFIQAFFRGGHIGVTISSRIGTAAAHGHRWGLIGFWLLDHVWPFGIDKVTGVSHCKGAILMDCVRARTVLQELEGDPIVAAFVLTK